MYGFPVICLLFLSSAFAQNYGGRPSIRPRPGGIIDPIGGIGPNIVGDCYRNEVPSYLNGRAEWCSYTYFQCNDPRAQCRITRGTTGTCCRTTGLILNTCPNNYPGRGSCYSDRECRSQFGREYECKMTGISYGTCCLRYGHGMFV